MPVLPYTEGLLHRSSERRPRAVASPTKTARSCPNMRTNPRVGILAGFAIAVVAVLYAANSAYRNAENMIEASRQVAHTDEVGAELQGTLAAVTQSEASQRGFTITGDPSDLVQYREAESKSQYHLGRMRALTRDNPAQQKRVSALERVVQQKMAWQLHVVEVRQKRGGAAASAEVASGRGRALMAEVQQIVEEMQADEARSLDSRALQSEGIAARTLQTVTLFSCMVVLLLLYACNVILRDLRLRQQVQQQLEQTQQQLRDALETETERARVDPLTGLANRRAFMEVLESERCRSSRYRRPLTLAYLDLDNFKLVNDRYGHAEGDALLRTVAQLLSQSVRRSDTIARMGGDEFALLLPETGLAAAETALRNIRKKLAAAMLEKAFPVTLSVGSMTFLDFGMSLDSMLLAADRLMYEVKQHGKDGLSAKAFGGESKSAAAGKD